MGAVGGAAWYAGEQAIKGAWKARSVFKKKGFRAGMRATWKNVKKSWSWKALGTEVAIGAATGGIAKLAKAGKLARASRGYDRALYAAAQRGNKSARNALSGGVDHYVYRALKNGKPYFGRSDKPVRRWAEHRLISVFRRPKVIGGPMSYRHARAVEDFYIRKVGLGRLANARYGISAKHSFHGAAMQYGKAWNSVRKYRWRGAFKYGAGGAGLYSYGSRR